MRIIIAGLICFFSVFNTVRAQYFTPIHNAQAPDYISVVKYFGIPYGASPALNSTRVIPGALFYNTTDSSMYSWTGTQWNKILGDSTAITNIINNYITQNNFSTFGIDSTTRLITGSVVIDSGLVGHNTDLYYKILGRFYNADYSPFTIDPSTGNDRKVTIVADTLGNVYVKYGTYSNPASDPIIDPESECPLVTYTVRNGVDTVVGVTNIWVYREAIEWQLLRGTISTGFDSAYTINPYAGLLSLRIPSQISGQYYEVTDGLTHNRADYTILDFYLRLNSAFNKNTKWGFTFFMDSSLVTSNTVVLTDGQFGYDRTTSAAYQAVAIPFNQFNFTGQTFNKIRITNIGNGSIPYQIDDMKIQAGGGNINTGNFIETVNGVGGAHVIIPLVDTGYYNADTSRLILSNRATGYVFANLPSLLAYLQSSDTCIVIDTTNFYLTKTAYFSLSTNCRGGNDSAYLNATVYGSEVHLYRGNGDSTVLTLPPGSGTVTSVAKGYGIVADGAITTTGTITADSTVLASKTYVDAVASLKKDKADSVISTGYATQYDLTKTKDSLQTNIDLKADKSITLTANTPLTGGGDLSANRSFGVDTTSGTATSLVTQYQRKKTSDSLQTNIDTKISNITGLVTQGTNVTITGSGTSGSPYVVNSSGGGSSLTRQVITSGSSGTVTGGNYIVTIDPASTLAAYTLTMPASPSDLEIVEVNFGGTLTSGMVVTSLVISANSGQTILDNTPPGMATADNSLYYRYRTANTTWYRFKL